MKLRDYLGVIVHWDAGGVKDGNIEGLMEWMRTHRDPEIFYHWFVSGKRVVFGTPLTDRCLHCGNDTYTPEATKYFGDYYCPPYPHSVTPHRSSPNNCTLAVCMLHDYPDGGYSLTTMETAAQICGYALYRFGIPKHGLMTHTEVVGKETKLCPKAFYDDPSLWDDFKREAFKSIEWFATNREWREMK